MLAAVQQALQALHSARSDGDFAKIVGDVATRFGFRSAYIIKYSGALRDFDRCIDVDARRLAWWPTYFNSDLRPAVHKVLANLGAGPVLRSTGAMHQHDRPEVRVALAMYDLLDTTTIPISYEQVPVGVMGFSGDPPLDAEAEMALQVIAYALFAQLRSVEQPAPGGMTLTPREREVIRLSAEGLTSVEIAERLGMSARTANQHIDNVADKLGTRNRAHTVAEAIRHNLLN